MGFDSTMGAIMGVERLMTAKVNMLRGLQSVSGEGLSALMPSLLDKAFKGEL